MKPLQIELPPLHLAQRTVRDNPARFRVLACGRRWGKSRLASALATECALQRGQVWIIVPVYSLGEPMFADVRRLAVQIPGAPINRSDRRIDYPGGGMVQIKTGDAPELLRGTSLDLAVFDEAAHTAKLAELWAESIRPALADRKGKALFCSTPNGRNYFWQLYQQGLDPQQSDWASWQLPTSSNPYIDAQEIESARRGMTERQFSQEFLAEFADDSNVFRNIIECATGKAQLQPIAGHEYSMGLDWGRSYDHTVICVYDVTARAVAYLDRFTGLPFDVQLGRVQTAIERWRPGVTVCELNSIGKPLFETLERRELPTSLIGFTTTNQNKAALVDCLALALERRELALLDHPVLIGELQSFTSETLPTGLTRYGAPASGHDDTVMALLLAYGPNAEGAPAEIQRTGAEIGLVDMRFMNW